jgi:DNA-binding response OmpR family regulator
VNLSKQDDGGESSMRRTNGSRDLQAKGSPDQSDRGAAIMLVEPDGDLRRVIAASLRIYDWKVIQATSPSSAADKLDDARVDVLLLGVGSSPESNTKLVEAYREEEYLDGSVGMVLLMTSHRIQERWREILRPDAVIYKPFDMRYLCQRIAQLIEARG